MDSPSEKRVKNNLWAALLAVARAVATEDRLEPLLRAALAGLLAARDTTDSAMILLREPTAGRLELSAVQGNLDDPTRPAPAEIVAFLDDTGMAGDIPLPGVVCLPLRVGDTGLGYLALASDPSRPGPPQSDLPFLEDVVALLAQAIWTLREREALRVAQAQNEARQRKAEMISVLAHEMRTPLTSIKGYSTALLMEGVTFDPETQREFLHIIDEECDVLQNLIRDLLESSNIDAGLLQIERQPTRLSRLARSLVEDLARHASDHRFLVDFPRDFPIVDADPDRITQVLRNLLDNAVKYSSEGGLVVVRGEVQAGEVVISVADQGIGIAPEHLNRLFEKYFRVKASRSRGVAGSGLGLPIARAIVEAHGGRIWAESRVGQGSTFTFTLPLDAHGSGATDNEE